jgi:predicted Zn-ribbon and HTH transcriptional regulator
VFRKDLLELLRDRPMTLYEIGRLVDATKRDVEDDVRHLAKSLKQSREHRLVVHPAQCRKCGFVFGTEHLHKPGKCPACHHTWITEPTLEVIVREG